MRRRNRSPAEETGRRPLARREGLLLKEVGDELIVYDSSSFEAHCLSPTLSSLWKLCDGRASVENLVDGLEACLGVSVDERVVSWGLQQLAQADLLEESSVALPADGALSRRELVHRLGLGGASLWLLPVITTVTAPTPAMAQTCLPSGLPCASSQQCCSGCCNSGTLKCVGVGNCLP